MCHGTGGSGRAKGQQAHLSASIDLVADVGDEGLGEVLQQGMQQARLVQHHLFGRHAVPAPHLHLTLP